MQKNISKDSSKITKSNKKKKFLLVFSGLFYILPLLCLLSLGLLWLFENGKLFYFIPIFLLSSLIGYFIFKFSVKRSLQFLSVYEPQVPEWSNQKDESAWDIVRVYQERISKKEYNPENPDDYLKISRNLLKDLSSHYYPDRQDPELEVSIPHLLHALSRTIDDLNVQIKKIPASHLITINSIRKTHRSYKKIKKYYDFAQFFYLVLRPKTILFQWIKKNMTKLLMENISAWFMGTFVFFFGQRIIELYGGKILLTEDYFDDAKISEKSQKGMERSREFAEKVKEQPVTITVCGQVNSGKSSLINAIFGDMKSATDRLPATDGIIPFVLKEPDDENCLIIYDTPGYEAAGEKYLSIILKQALESDIIILCSFATNAAREPDRIFLEKMRERIDKSGKFFPPVIIVTAGIDLIRPVTVWSVPFDLVNPQTNKEIMISKMVDVVKKELGESIKGIVPVCLLEEKLYNVSETLIPTIYNFLPEAKRALLFRVMKDIKRSENLKLLFKQALESGKIIMDLIGKISRQ